MPPPGGFESVKYKRNLPFRGPGALAILGGVTLVSAYGFYRLGKGNLEKRYVTSVCATSTEVQTSAERGTCSFGSRSSINVWIRPPNGALICTGSSGP